MAPLVDLLVTGEYGEEREHGGKGARLHSPFFVEVFAGSARDRIVLSTL
jgi:hypothetical protein